jgi:tetratricopeptide (TPR) repeat protein
MGNMDKAVHLLEESVALDRKGNYITHQPLSLDFLGFAYQILGEWDKSEQYYQEALSISQKVDDYQAISGAFGFLGWFNYDKGEYIKAREFFEKMYEVMEKHGATAALIGSSRYVIATYIELGEKEKAENLLDKMHEMALEKDRKDLIATSDGLKANLFRAEKKLEESVQLFEKSLQEFEALAARHWNVYWFAKMVLCEYARTYLERNQEGDREKAYNLLNQALEIFQKIGAKKDIERIIAKKKLLTA